MMDEVRRLSDELARDPSGMAFLQLGELLRRRDDLETAFRVAIRGLQRHPHDPDAHDLLARIYSDRGELDLAFDEWDMTVRLSPSHAGALRGMGYIRYQQERLVEAEQYLQAAVEANPSNAPTVTALNQVRAALQEAAESGDPAGGSAELASHEASDATAGRASPADNDPRYLFADLMEGGENSALLLDSDGLVLAGGYRGAGGDELGAHIGAHLSGVSEEAGRAMRHLNVGAWEAIIVETGEATVAMAPAPGDGLLVVAAARSTPLGLVQKILGSVATRARSWLASGAAQ
jgi:predicted regulator of Ras-like GTPase activity (Roadblock/LC7/MglB family)